MERRSWLYAGGSKQIPSSVLVVHGAATVAVLSNGSCFVHLLQIEDSIRNTVIKFSSRVQFVASFLPLTSVVLCCLDDGRVSALHVKQALTRLEEAPFTAGDEDADDVFSMLLGSSAPNDDEENRHILGEEEFCTELVRVADKVCNAALQGHRLIFLARTSAGDFKLTVHASCGTQESVPLFNATPSMVYQLQVAVFPALQCSFIPFVSPLLPIDTNSLPEEFYRQLCQPDQFLLRAPLVLVGSQAGHVYCLSNAPEPSLFCALNQPVVGIHATEVSGTTTGDLVNPSTSVIICVGQRGRIVLCRMGDSGQTSPRFSELQLNAPILCTCVIPRQYLLYGTPDGLYSVCLSPTHCAQQPEHSSLEMAFRFPQKVAQTVAHLLMPVVALRVFAVSLGGLVTTFSISPELQSRSECAAGDLRQVLRCIETTAKQTSTFSERLSSLDAKLAELNEALDLVCDLSQPTATFPLRCKLRPTCVHTGASSLQLTLHLSLEYTRHRALRSGWSLLANIRMKSGRQNTEVIPIEGLSTANAHQFGASFPVIPVARGPLDVSVHCVLHYVPTTSTEGVSFSLHEETFSAVHFLLPCDPSSFLQPVGAAVYSARLSLVAGVVLRQCRSPADVCEAVLTLGVLQHAVISPDCIRRGHREAELTLKAYNGFPVTILASLFDEAVEISVRSCSEAIVAEISSCISRALKERVPGANQLQTPPVAELKRELARLQSEMASSGPSRSLKSRTYQLYCRLRGINAT